MFDFDFYEPLPIRVEVSEAPFTSDAGLLPLRQFDDRIGLTTQFAAALHDPRDPDRIDHTFPEMVRSRVFGMLAGYADQNDHDTLRTDPVFKLLADRSPTDPDLASQPTLSRFENQIDNALNATGRGLLAANRVRFRGRPRPALPASGRSRLGSSVKTTTSAVTPTMYFNARCSNPARNAPETP